MVEAKNLTTRGMLNPYCMVELVGPKVTRDIGKTNAMENDSNPQWLFTIPADIDEDVIELRFTVKDRSLFKDEKLGSCSLNVSCIGSDEYSTTVNIQNKKQSDAGQLVIKVKFEGVEASGSSNAKLKGCIPRKTVENVLPESRFLHGSLKIGVKHGEQLPNLDASLMSRKNKSDPFVVVAIQDPNGELFKIARTQTIENDLSPEWNEDFNVDVCHDVSNIVFILYDEDIIKNDKMCYMEIPADEIIDGRLISGRRPLYKHSTKESGKLTISLQYTKNIRPLEFAMKNCVFPVRKENNARLYQDAHCSSLPATIQDHAGLVHSPASAWHDIYDTLTGAKKFICISGWSLNASIHLVKTECRKGDTIGKILLDRAEAGVDVRVLLWEEAERMDCKKDTAKEFFKESLVKVECVPRKKRKKDEHHRDGASAKFGFAHNQKFIVADQSIESSPGLRNVVAYLGSFDLTCGRYDTPDHKLHNNEETDQKHQFYSSLIATITKSSYKTPWHDVLCKVIGAGALDVYTNFQSRWETEAQCSESDFQIDKSNELFLEYSDGSVSSWDVQLFRSVCENSVRLEGSSSCVHTYGGTKIDNSLQRAYIHQIRKANQFIYIETTNFIGSCQFWDDCSDAQSRNLIPIEITMKIIEKIKERTSFTVYVVVSLHSEHNPDDIMAQEILHWQYHTMEMMYRKIGEAIKEFGVDTHPQDYLLFLTLVKSDEPDSTHKMLKQLSEDTPLPASSKRKRSMIFVNSKIGIFDDEYMIIGSGNINDRSMIGNRNTELAIGLHQPRLGAKGEVSTFRKCLWVEHLGENVCINANPNSIQCIRKIRLLGEETLKAFIDTTSHPTIGRHMMVYPVNIDQSGSVSQLPECDKFPDTKAHVLGWRSKVIPVAVTT